MIGARTVPAELGDPDRIVVERAWPDGDRGSILVEGRDRRGRVRPGRLHFDAAPGRFDAASRVGNRSERSLEPSR